MRNSEREKDVKAADIMTRDVVTLDSDASILDAIRVMLRRGISGLPVLNAKGGICGIVTEGDFLRRAELATTPRLSRLMAFLRGPGREADQYAQTHGRKLYQIMTPEVVTVAEDAPLEEVVGLMERHRIRRIPVVRNNTLVGIVSRNDLLRTLIRSLEAAAPVAARPEGGLAEHVREEISKKDWARGVGLSVRGRDGTVILEGVIYDERQRNALKIVAENVPCVQNVIDRLVWVDPNTGYTLDPEAECAGSGQS
jgi:CBS domain-containing protein